MKSKAQKQAEAIERNAVHRNKYLEEAKKLFDDADKQKAYADMKQGIPAKRQQYGGLAEWFNAPVLKTGDRESGPWVQIPQPPPIKEIQ